MELKIYCYKYNSDIVVIFTELLSFPCTQILIKAIYAVFFIEFIAVLSKYCKQD